MHQGYYRRGCALRELLRDDEALVALREAAELAPSDAEIRNKLAEVLQRGTTTPARHGRLVLAFSRLACLLTPCTCACFFCIGASLREGGQAGA